MIKALILKLAYYLTTRTAVCVSQYSWFVSSRCTEHIYKVVWHLESVCHHPTDPDLPQLQSIGQIPNHP